jgi:hypothetical protein
MKCSVLLFHGFPPLCCFQKGILKDEDLWKINGVDFFQIMLKWDE